MGVQLVIGRDRETGVLQGLLDHVHERGAALVVRGEAGIGKSALLAVARAHAEAQGMQVLTTTGVQSEVHLPFAGLHQVLRPILAGIDRLPARQRDALLGAFGAGDSTMTATDFFFVALAALELLADAAADAPLLLIAEDVQWLDRSTADVLAFIARRLETEPIILLLAVRTGFETPVLEAGALELHLAGLDAASSRALLETRAPDLRPSLRDRLLGEARGNPLALIELPLALRSEEIDSDILPLAPPPLTERLERDFAAHTAGLPDATRTLLLIAAADDEESLDEVLAAAALMGIEDREALDPAVSARLIEVDGATIRFRHPLVRSAIYRAANLSQRQAAHAALAVVLAAQPDRSVWHRAAAVLGSGEEIASELEEAATRARRRGAIATAVAALERAARLTEDPERRARRLLDAARMAFESNWRDTAERLLRALDATELGPHERARLLWLEEGFGIRSAWSGADPVRTHVEISEQALADGDADHALQSLHEITMRLWWGNPDQETRDLVIDLAERIPVPADNPALLYILACAAPIERGVQVIARLSGLAADERHDPDTLYELGLALTAVGDYERATDIFAAAITGLRAKARLGVLAQALAAHAWAAVHLGMWSVALPAASEAAHLARETGQLHWEAVARLAEAMVAGLRGKRDLAQSLAAEAEGILLPIGAGPLLALVQLARGVAALGAGQHTEAFEHLRRIFDPTDLAYHPYVRFWCIGDLVEAAVYSEHREEVRGVVDELEALAVQSQAPILQVGLSYARPLLADDADVGSLLQAGLEANLTRWPFIRARLLLAHGMWLRRQRRIAESRAPLRAAREAFDALGALAWSDRARQELRASGETSRKRTLEAWDQLSPQELQIARMAAEGLSNREIGERLFLSHRTVSTHLYRIFPKLGITSRSQLRMSGVAGLV